MTRLTKVVTVFAKIGEVGAIVGCVLSAILVGICATGHLDLVHYLATADETSTELSVNDFSLLVADPAGNPVPAAFTLIFITAFLVIGLAGMICRNVGLIFKTAEGRTKFSEGKTPFQPNNIRMVKEIGYFLIAIPAVELIMSIIANIVLGSAMVVGSVSLGTVFVALVVIALSQYFAYGMELEEDVEGLL